MDIFNGPGGMALRNLDHHMGVIHDEFQKKNPHLPTLVDCLVEVLTDTDVLISSEQIFQHKDSSCNCYEEIQRVFPALISTEQKIYQRIDRKVVTNHNECWLKRMCSKYKLFSLWYRRMAC